MTYLGATEKIDAKVYVEQLPILDQDHMIFKFDNGKRPVVFDRTTKK